MGASKKEKLVLYALHHYYNTVKDRLNKQMIEPTLTKTTFIELLMKAKLVEKKERAIYRNLESLEKQKLISYNKSKLRLTIKGSRICKKIHKDIEGFLFIHSTIKSGSPSTKAKRIQTIFCG